jgi:predicted nucleotidyltransferase
MGERPDISALELDVDTIADVLEDAPVVRAILFGSRARSASHGSSDIDIAVEFSPTLSSVERTRARLDLISGVSNALAIDAVDVVPLSAASADLRQEIRTDGIVLYGEEPEWFEPVDTGALNHEETLARFDEIVAALERVV